MAKKKKTGPAVDAEQNCDPPPPPKSAKGVYRITTRCKWVYPFVVIADVASVEEARAEMHRQLDAAVVQIELER